MNNLLFSGKTGKSRLFSNLNGFLVINKPLNWTSFDVVAKMRGKLHPKKIGHAGTLDPLATGVLVLCLGKATPLSGQVMNMEKEYVGEITLGATSETDDGEGPIIDNPNATEIPVILLREVLQSFTGTYGQLPPTFSAKKIGGDRAYQLARKGRPVTLEPAQVTVKQIELIDYKWPKIKLRVTCGKGFYVRSLARDLGVRLGAGGYLSSLQRTRVGIFTLNRAATAEEAGEAHLLPVDFISRNPCPARSALSASVQRM